MLLFQKHATSLDIFIIKLFLNKDELDDLRLEVVLLPSLGSARFGSVLARAFGQKARLGSLSFPKSSGLKNSANMSFLKNFEKDHWQSTVLMGKFQFFLSTMAPEGHFQPKD